MRSVIGILSIAAAVGALTPVALAADLGQCKGLYRQLVPAEGQLADLDLAGEREMARTEAGTARSIRNALDSARQAVREGRTPTYAATLEQRMKFAQDLGMAWDPRWELSSEGFYDAMIRAHEAIEQRKQQEASGFTQRMTRDPGNLTFRDIERGQARAREAVQRIRAAFDGQGCDRSTVRAALAAESQAQISDQALIDQLRALSAELSQLVASREGPMQAGLRYSAQLSFDATNNAARAGELLGTLQRSGAGVGRATYAGRCAAAEERMRDVSEYARQASSRYGTLDGLLKSADAIHCSQPNAATMIRQRYNEAIKQLGQIGALQKKAAAANEELKRLLSAPESREGKQLLDRVEEYARTIEGEASLAAARAGLIATQLQQDQAAAPAFASNVLALRARIAPLYEEARKRNWRDSSLDRIRSDLERAGALSTAQPQHAQYLAIAQKQAAQAQASATQARGIAQSIQSRNAACSASPMDAQVEAIGSDAAGAFVLVSDGARLRDKADACAVPAACRDVPDQARGMMRVGRIDEAAARIAQARAAGCDVKTLEQELEGYRWLRDTGRNIQRMIEQCRYQDAIDFARQIPEKYRGVPVISTELTALRTGGRAMNEVKRAVDAGQAALQRGDRASYERQLAQARRVANSDPRFAACANKLIPALQPPVPAPPPPKATPAPQGGACTPTICTPENRTNCVGSPTAQTFFRACVANATERCEEGESGRTGSSCMRKGADKDCHTHAVQVCTGAAARFGFPTN